MVRDYVEGMYEPTAERSERMSEAKHARARAFAAWKQRVVANWPAVRVVEVDADASPALADLGSTRKVSVVVSLGALDAKDVAVQLLHGPVGPNDELINTSLLALEPASAGEGGHRYEGAFTCERAGRYGIAARVVPAHPDLVTFAEMDCVAWA
jgi:starch phosphorylase